MRNLEVKNFTCPSCEKGTLCKKMTSQELNIQGMPTISVDRVPADVCDNCGETLVDFEVTKDLDRRFLYKVWDFYSDKTAFIPGKVANWIRKVAGISARELASLSGIEESTLSHSNNKNTNLDRYTATILMLKVKDFLEGSSKGADLVKKLSSLNEFWPKLKVEDVIKRIEASHRFIGEVVRPVSIKEKRSAHKTVAKKTTRKSVSRDDHESYYLAYFQNQKKQGHL